MKRFVRSLARRSIKKDIIFAIESSCDDTCFAVLNDENNVIEEYKYSQKKLHQPFGGVVPQLAAQCHRDALQKIGSYDLIRSYIRSKRVKFIAVTTGPGIGGCLSAGYEFARQLGRSNNIPLIPINHLLGHLLSVDYDRELNFPRLSLIVSGGNTQLVFSRSVYIHHILGLTIDDAVGEALDKTARLLNCKWSEAGGLGTALEKLAFLGKPINLEIESLSNYKDPLSFSFSGLKTALKSFISNNDKTGVTNEDLAATIQTTLFGHVIDRVANCMKIIKKAGYNINSLSLIGGVARNNYLREALEDLCNELEIHLVSPSLGLCTDNAVMIGLAAKKLYPYLNSRFSLNSNRVNSNWTLEDLSINKLILE